MTENYTRKIIKEFHGESKYPSGATCTVKIELFEDGQLIQTETVGYSNSTVTFDKKYKSLSYAKKKLDRLRDKYLGHTLLSRARAEGEKYD
jgi:hypothetical protein